MPSPYLSQVPAVVLYTKPPLIGSSSQHHAKDQRIEAIFPTRAKATRTVDFKGRGKRAHGNLSLTYVCFPWRFHSIRAYAVLTGLCPCRWDHDLRPAPPFDPSCTLHLCGPIWLSSDCGSRKLSTHDFQPQPGSALVLTRDPRGLVRSDSQGRQDGPALCSRMTNVKSHDPEALSSSDHQHHIPQPGRPVTSSYARASRGQDATRERNTVASLTG
jgi:hypothetical protein